ncbi:probable disease resistance protein At4g27220 [Pistacia vera]|uniref:probable disease resistance protein At4g27220 n=1 Tax=Pistacia vera TaxID=55513 RepID=UPI001262C061|nr:probable disease resistance protein At4g27220 [Pistacia vera]XP_031274951.1 probable disease resistance protein At4g27220 [Pistacia vera]
MRCQQRILLNELDEGEGLSLLKKHAGIDDEFHPLNDVAIKVAKECKGLPLAIVTIGSALKEKGIDEWKLVFEKLKKSKLVDMCKDIDVDEDVYAILKVSYDYLEGKETKLCFLLCSLFPEDYEIPLEELAKCGMGLGLFSYADSIEQARSQLRVIVNKLKASCLLIDASDEELVKMHDVVRDVALGIASIGENSFMVKAGLGLTEWPKEEKHLEQYTAISLMANKLLVLPDHVVCPKLETFLLSRQYCHYRDYNIEVSNHFFQEMKALKNLTLSYVNLSLKSLTFLTNLIFLELIDCNLRDISSLKHLIRLEILSLRNSLFDEFPKELGALTELRLLDLRTFCQLKKLSSNVIQRFSQLEELYVGDCFDKWEDERTRVKGSNASLSEFKSLSKLVVLFLETNTKCLPKDFGFVCNKLLRYDISVNTYTDCHVSESRKKALTIKDIEAPSLITFKALSPTLEYLCLKEVTGCENILPSIDKGGLNKLNSLVLEDCKDLKCIIDTFQMQVPNPTFSNLVKLSLTRLNLLREICCGPCGKLQSLTNLKVRECKSLTCLFTLSLARSLVQLKSLELSDCESLKHLFMREEVDNDRGKEILSESNHVAIVLPNLEKLSIEKLPQLRCIWKGPTYHVNLKNLIDVKVRECKSLTYLFTLSHVRSLVQLKSLEVHGCENLEHLVITEEVDNDEGEDMRSKYDHYIQYTFLSNLESLQINSCERLEYIFPISVARVLVQLQMLTIENAPQLKQVFFGDHGREEGDGKEIAVIEFAQLKVLKLYGLANIIRFCPENYHSIWPALEDFKMDRCSYLSTSFIAEVVAKVRNQEEKLRILCIGSCNQLCDIVLSGLKDGFFKNLEELSIYSNGVNVVFQLQGLVTDRQHILSLPNLKTLRLYYWQELEGLCKSPAHLLSLENLITLDLDHCNRLRNIFTPSLARNLLRLQTLYVYDCEELKEIIAEDDEEDQSVLKDNLQPLFFQNLLEIIVVRCPKLRRLFPVTMAQGLQELEKIFVFDNSQFEEVFGHENVAGIMDHKRIVLRQLNWLSLKALPSLTNFCQEGYHFIFPSMSSKLGSVLIVKDCPKIATRFSLGEDKSVHAEAKARKLRKPYIEIECYSDQIRQRLPPYV